MSSRRTPSPVQIAKACYFCGRTGGMSKEHIWPQWMRPLAIGAGQETTTWTTGFSIPRPGAVREIPVRQWKRQGSPATAKVREVCTSCNNGWMSRLESDVRPLIERLLPRCDAFGQTAFSSEEARLLSAWALKCSWMRELAEPGEPTPLQAMREQFMQDGHPPAGSMVFAARHDGNLNFHSRVARIDLKHRDHQWDSSQVRRVLVCCLTFAGMTVLTITADGDGVPTMVRDARWWVPVWPCQALVPWPAERALSDRDVDETTTRLRGWIKIP